MKSISQYRISHKVRPGKPGGENWKAHLDVEILLEPVEFVLLALVRLDQLFECVLDLHTGTCGHF